MKKWERIEPTIIHKAGYRTLVDKTFLLPNGATYTPTTMDFEGREAVAILALTPDNEVVVVRQFRPGPEKIMDEIPGGIVDAGETKEAAAERELLEETGYKSGRMLFLGTAYYDAYTNTKRHCFLATDCVKTKSQAKGAVDEIIELRLVSIDEIMSITRKGQMTDFGPVVMANEELQKRRGKK